VNEIILYEQPLNEQMRLCLRLEHLFTQIQYHLDLDSEWSSREIVRALLEVLNVIDRPDLKKKFAQVLNQYVAALVPLEHAPDVDRQTLHNMINRLNQAINTLHDMQGRIGQELRENEFLLAIQQRLSIAAGTCPFSLPPYHLWLQQPSAVKMEKLCAWYDVFTPLREIIELLLQLTRESTELRPQIAIGGFFQASLEPEIPYQMIRLKLNIAKYNMFPEFSVGRHRLSMHFFELNTSGKANQTTQDVKFKLACCKLYVRDGMRDGGGINGGSNGNSNGGSMNGNSAAAQRYDLEECLKSDS
jgi:cell division protein ZapD